MLHWRITFTTIVIALAIGGAAGVLGTAFTSSYLSDYAIQLSELTKPLRLAQERPRNFPSSYKEAVDQFIETALPSVAEVYRGNTTLLGYTDSQRVATGLVLTSDGWIGVHTAKSGWAPFATDEIRIRGQIYPVYLIVKDPITSMTFIKVEANGLPVSAFGNAYETKPGEQLFVANESDALMSVQATEQIWPGAQLVSSDEPNRFLRVDRELTEGSIVFNLNAEAIGFATEDDKIFPIEAILPSLRSLLETQEMHRASLGIEYVDIAHAINISQELVGSYRYGALLYTNASVPRTSPAFEAGVRPGDILLSVNGELVNGIHGLDELIASKRPGDHIQILLSRDDQEQIFEVLLGEVK